MPAPRHPDEGWIPVAFGALDVHGRTDFVDGAEILVVPCSPADALCLVGEGAALWRRLVGRPPVPAVEFDDHDTAVLAQLGEAGLVVYARAHPAAVTRLDTPVLSSPLHELVYALVQRVAVSRGIPCVFVKGPVLHHQSLRDREHSADVDVWCDPARWDELVQALAPWGWTREPDPWWGTSVHHTATMVPSTWGCEIDVHRRFPGLTLDDDEAFAAVSAVTEPRVFAGTTVAVPRRGAHAVLSALHLMRPAVGTPTDDAAARLAHEVLVRVPDAVENARGLGAASALLEQLRAAFPGVDPGPVDGVPRDWRHRSQPDRAHAYLAALGTLPLRERARVLLRLIWPPDDIALASARRAGETPASARHARVRRLVRGVRSFHATRGRRP